MPGPGGIGSMEGGPNSNTYNTYDKTTSTEKQSAVVVDAISEGPIYGLVDGASSVLVNGVPLIDKDTSKSYGATTSNATSYTASNRTVSDSTLFLNKATNDGTFTIQIAGARKAGTGIASTTAGRTLITTSSNFFAFEDKTNLSLPQTVKIIGAGPEGSDYYGVITQVINATSVQVRPAPSTTTSSKNISIDLVANIASISGNTAILEGSGTLGINASSVNAQISSPSFQTGVKAPVWNYDDCGFAFRSGTRDQPYLSLPGNVGTNSITANISQTLNSTDFSNITHNGSAVFTSGYAASGGWTKISEPDAARLVFSSDAMGVAEAGEVDAIKVSIKFPSGLIAVKPGDGHEEKSFAEFQILFEYSVTGNFDDTVTIVKAGHSDAQLQSRSALPGRSADSFGGKAGTHTTTGTIKKQTKTPFVQTFSFDVSQHHPFNKYRIKIAKVTPTNGFNERRYWYNSTQVQAIQNIITDKLSYPYTAYGAVVIGAKEFSTPPRRSYEIRGLQVKVPTNYFARHELLEGANASYTRKVANNITVTNESSYQDWDGNFRGDIKTFTNPTHSNYAPVWTDNPVWILLDILTNDRYGLGKFVDPDDNFQYIDKFQLFQLAKYCDELVPDGKGGLEPRFTANLYLSKLEEAQKVIKDLLLIFRGLLIWFDGKLSPSVNAYKSPIYTFTKGNIVGGDFNYQSSSTRFRSNQIRVTWNNPEDMFKQEVEIVEDTQNILETGKIISKDVSAVGCTSRGQAHRYGKWHILTEKMEKEVVTFSTGLNGSVLRPGDVIEVQDSDLSSVQNSGRVSSTGTRSTTVVALDREITISAGKSYILNLIYPTGGAYLSQDKATINSVAYTLGDLVLLDESGASIDTLEKASNVKDDSGDLVQLYWSEEVRVESKVVGAYNNTSKQITVSSAFSAVPNAEVIWSLTSHITATGQEEEDISPKEYIVVSTEEKEKNIVSIAAVEYSNKKFELIDRGYVTEIVPEDLKPPLRTDIVPPPESLSLRISHKNQEGGDFKSHRQRANLLVSWQPPLQIKLSTTATVNGNVSNSTSVTLSAANSAIKVGMRVRASTIGDLVTVSAIDGTALTLSSAKSFSNGATLSFKHEIPEPSIAGYEVIIHGPTPFINGRPRLNDSSIIRLPSSETSVVLENIDVGTHFIHVRAVNNISNFSKYVTKRITFRLQKHIQASEAAKIDGIDKGGVLDVSLAINGSGVVTLSNSTYSFTHTNGIVHKNTSTNTSTYQQAFNGMGASAEAYLVFDASESDTGDRFKALEVHEDSTATDISGAKLNIDYWKEVGASNNGLTTKSGTVTISDSNNTVTGSSTAFTTEFEEGDLIVVGSGSTAFYSKIAFIESDTVLELEEVPTREFSGASISKPTFSPDFTQDQILAKITTNSSTVYTINELYAITAGTQGADGQPGQSNAIVYAYQRSATALSSNPGAVTVSLTGTTSGTITTGSLANGWSKTIPSGTNPLYICAATAAGTGSTDTIAANEWSSPVILAESGEDGAAGINSATVFLYQNNNTGNAPSNLPSGNVTYTFADGSIGSFGTSANGWTIANPGVTNSNNYLWVTQATAAANTATDVIADSEWAAIKLLAQKGDDGATGPRTTTFRLNHTASASSPPTAPTSSNTNSFNFSNGTLGTILSGWSHSTPTYASGNSNKYWYVDVTVVEATFGGSQTISFGSTTQAIGFSGLVTFSSANTISDGTNTKTPIQAGDVNANVTSIDGDVIQTGTIKADRLALSGNGAITIGSFTNDSGFTDDTVANQKTTAAAAATAANNANKTNGSVGGLSLTATKMHLGTGTFNNSNTAFYVDNSSNFSLGDKLSWNGTNLSINGGGTFSGALSAATGTFSGSLVVGGTSTTASTIVSGAASGATANQDSTSTIRSVGAATSGTIAAWTISATKISNSKIEIDNTEERILIKDS